MARKSIPPVSPSPAQSDQGRGLDVATVVPWIAFWGWVALDSALAYRKGQTAQDESYSAPETPDPPPVDEARNRPWPGWSVGARAAMISAPIIALFGPLVLDKLMRRRKP